MVRCELHGDYVAGRTETIKLLRNINDGKPVDVAISPPGGEFNYRPPTGPSCGERQTSTAAVDRDC